ncbi:GIY-YIG nuclease family protein [Bradyrhizobium sp.]|jgi:putative endonuclease|uniref:GIY-YIG nuclease family protein n=1 Tax=Bradyrhizobium sp. TaxID=376 RepID=UPI002E0B9A24|nr:GIY-YIG nuclease family protein [Bradyrhizobium sp.]
MAIYVYMLRCADNSYYVGSATGDDLQPRIDQHNSGAFHGYTFRRRPVTLVWSESFDRITDGIAAERQIKGWSRAKKEALIEQDWLEITRLSRRGSKSKPR